MTLLNKVFKKKSEKEHGMPFRKQNKNKQNECFDRI